MKTRNELIVELIIQDGKFQSKSSAFKFLRSESAKAEAELIHLSRLAQSEAIESIEKIKSKDLEQYKTQKMLDNVKIIFGRMIGNCEVVSRRMIIANILSSKINAVIKLNLTTDELIKRVELDDDDRSRIDKMVLDILEKIKSGVAFTTSSISTTIQNLAIHVNANRSVVLPKDKDKKTQPNEDKKKVVVKQEVISSAFSGENVKQKRPQKTYKDIPLTQADIDLIKKNPISFANSESKKNINFVTDLHNRYLKGVDTPLNSSKQREKSIKNAEGNLCQKSIFELGENLRKNGLFAFIDKGNKRWTLESYLAMSFRTASSQSTNTGELFADKEHDLYYIIPHGGSCPLCRKYEGRVYSRSGKDPNYPPLSSVFSKINPNGTDDLENMYLTIHPNCRHKIVKYIAKDKTKYERRKIKVKSTKPFELTRRQESEVKYYKNREKDKNARDRAMKEFLMYLQVLPPKDVCGNFLNFYEHKKNNDSVYKEVKQKYKLAIENKNK